MYCLKTVVRDAQGVGRYCLGTVVRDVLPENRGWGGIARE